MAKYQRIVTTKAGLELLESVTLGGTIQFTSLKTGTGTYDGSEDLAAMTSIKSVRQTFGILSVTKEASDILVRTILCNNDVTVGYAITELGLYVKNPTTGAEVLFAITVAASGCEDYMPVYAEEPTSIVVDFVIGITDSEKVTFAVAPMKDTYVQLTTFNEFVAKTNDEIALERARIDTFTSLPDGATQNDAALADICVGADGTTYASPGIAVRTQFANVNNEVAGAKSDLSEITTEKLTPISAETFLGKYISGYSGNKGQLVEVSEGSSQWEVTDYVDVTGYKRIAITAGATTNRLYYAFYDVDKKYITGRPYESGVVLRDEIIDVPAGAKYCVAMWYYTTADNSPIIKGVSLAPKTDGTVQYDTEQTLDETQKLTVRNNIGAASVESIEEVENQINAEKQITATFTSGYFVNAVNGNIVGDSRYSASDYIYIRSLDTLTFPCYFSGQYAGAAIYDKNKQFVRGVTLDGSVLGAVQTVQVGEGECYIRITCQTTQLSNFSLKTENVANAVVKLGQLIEDDDALDYPMSKIIRDGGMTSIFSKIGVIGDSLSSGEMAYGGSTDEFTTKYVDMYDFSWIQFLARTCGSTAYNFSQGGLNTRNFLADLGGHLTNMRNPEKKCQAYFIALGHNDANYGVPVGTVDNINLNDPSQNADTYYGNYAKIIAEIKAVEPDAKIFCICMKSSGYSAYNLAIRHMATIYDNVYIIDFETYYPKLETSWEYTEGHGNAMGYLNYSWQIGSYVDWIIRNNRNDFMYVQFIGTDYAQYIP